MTIIVTRQSSNYDATKVNARRVCYDPSDNTYHWVESIKREKSADIDVAVGTVDASDLPPEVSAAALYSSMEYPPYVEWSV